MPVLTYEVLPGENGAQVKTVLQNRGISTGMMRRLKQSKGILLNGLSVTVRQKVFAGQRITLQLPESLSSNIIPIPIPLDVVYEDDWILAVNKPCGMPVHPSAGHHNDSLAGGVAYYLGQTDLAFHPITRLDRYTSGIVLIAKNSVAAANLSKQIGEGKIRKKYYGVTCGIPFPLEGEVNQPIEREENSVIKRRVYPTGKPAKTLYKVEETKGNLALVRVEPVTGRTHQIRVHMAFLGCPLYSDFLYGKEEDEQPFLLQCTQLSFTHPATGEFMVLKIPQSIW